jgi:hypothetical protein
VRFFGGYPSGRAQLRRNFLNVVVLGYAAQVETLSLIPMLLEIFGRNYYYYRQFRKN